eukprot:4075589-Alexandrium_andersonii.AAC.1
MCIRDRFLHAYIGVARRCADPPRCVLHCLERAGQPEAVAPGPVRVRLHGGALRERRQRP